MKNNLKNCPFCGAKVSLFDIADSNYRAYGKIKLYRLIGHEENCFLENYSLPYIRKEQLIKTWNNRIDDILKK